MAKRLMVFLCAVLLLIGAASGTAQAGETTPSDSEKINVSVGCGRGDDSIGLRLCFAVKEKIRASQVFHLVDDCKTKALCIWLITMDTGQNVPNHGQLSAVSLLMTAGAPISIYHALIFVGGDTINEQAERIVATADKEVTHFKGRSLRPGEADRFFEQ
jgi:hypothetical protein